MEMNLPPVLVTRPRAAVMLVTLNRPEARNAISRPVADQLSSAVARAAEEPEIRAIVLTGTGDRAFCAGYDIHELAAVEGHERDELLADRERLLLRLLASPVPIVAALNGAAHGGGSMYAMCADIRVASPASSLSFAAVKYGGVALTWLLDTLVGGAWARDLLLTGRKISGADLYHAGLVTRWTDEPSGLLDHAIGVAEELADLPSDAVRAHKALLLEHWGTTIEERYGAEQSRLHELLATVTPREMFATFLDRERGG
jgi:2-(1,2-epoxy-1,2-dihydrophenyl)acetyl-CoA isomerase